MKKRILSLVLALGLLTLTACGTATPTASPATSDAVQPSASTPVTVPAEPVKLTVGYGNHLGCALYFIADEMGYFEEYGLDVELVPFQDGTAGLAALQAGQIDAGSFGSTASFSLISQGQDITIFGGQMHEGSGIITTPERVDEFSDFANYKGKTLGLVRMSTGDVVFRYGLIKAGLTLGEDVTIVELDSAAAITEAVKKGEVDAGGSWIPNLKNAEAQSLDIAMLSGEVIANHPCAVMVSMKDSLSEHAEDFVNLHKALIKAFDLFEHDHEQSIAAIQKYLELDTEVLESEAYSRYSPNPEINEAACIGFWNAMNEIGYIDSDLDIEGYIDSSMYNKALEEMISENPDNTFYQELAKGGYGSNA